MLRTIPGTVRNNLNQGSLLNRRNRLTAKLDVKAVFRKILQPTRFKLSELFDEPVIGESLNQIITSSRKWRRYIDQITGPRNDQGSLDHSTLLQSVFRCVYCHKRNGAVRYYSIEKWKAIQAEQKDGFISQGILKECPAELIKERCLPVCRSHLILKNNGKLRLISIPAAFNNRFKQPGGLVEFIHSLHDQVPFIFRPSLPDVSISFKALTNFRSLIPNKQTFFLGRIDIADCFNNIDHKLLLKAFKKAVSKAEQFSSVSFSRDHVISELSYFLNNYIIQFAGRCYQQTRGIPQGSCISTDLSNLFLAFVDRSSSLKDYFWDAEKRISSDANVPKAAILRFHDDYLLLATTKRQLLDIKDGLINSKLFSKLVGLESVEWLGLEITPQLDLLIPQVNISK
ncbi:unnamed protein product [Hymenolepis diminuta]|uniref:Telomerase reverse transcriptase n=1 Tax=Hymenolepis diminuta TaxID=6216 RepID=A0A0R3SCB3_HYMDI|nr:unnamed protein product [Hymenolepis diminuta]